MCRQTLASAICNVNYQFNRYYAGDKMLWQRYRRREIVGANNHSPLLMRDGDGMRQRAALAYSRWPKTPVRLPKLYSATSSGFATRVARTLTMGMVR